ncbi:hypothetical protein RI129_002997 [Pyrocoelia pectoralis]|uniref:Uncharacterized protein n=1 Tax=Pyrocoelia pectoralis TaxID=417401 RepID=A0AAN7VH13_9COLE
MNNQQSLEKQMEAELQHSSQEIYVKSLKRALMGKGSIEVYTLVDKILQNIIIPDECFKWYGDNADGACIDTINTLVNVKVQIDSHIKMLLEVCVEKGFITHIELEHVISQINVPLNLKISFKKYVCNFLNDNGNCDYLIPNVQYSIENVKQHYHDITWATNEFISTAAYYANCKSLKLYTDVTTEQNFKYIFKPYFQLFISLKYNFFSKDIIYVCVTIFREWNCIFPISIR